MEGFISKSNVKKHYAQVSFLYGFFEKIFENKLREKSLKILQPRKGEVILEVGTGTGCALLEISRTVGLFGKVFGIDINKKMLKLSKKRLNKQKRAFLFQADAINLPFEKDFFDAVYVIGTLDVLNLEGVVFRLEEFKRVLKPEGRIVLGSLNKKKKPPILFSFYRLLQKFFPNHFISRPIKIEKLVRDSGYIIEKKEDILVSGIFPMRIIKAIPY